MNETIETAKPATILLVDDSPVNLELVVESLEVAGYEVLVAVDGEEALARAEMALPDLILLDVMMPGLDGFEVCRRLKAGGSTRDIPVIFMTSLSGVPDKVRGFTAGAVDYLTKPLQLDEVRARIDTHLKLRALQRRLEERNAELVREIAARQRLESELRAREASLAEAQRIGHMGSWELDLTSGALTWSDEIYRLFEIDPSRFGASYKAFLDVIHPDDRDAVDRVYAESVRSRKPYEIDHRLRLADGRVRHVRERCETLYGVDGEAILSRGTVQDITEIKETQLMLERSQAELRRLAAHRDTVLEDERRHLSREMHEELGQVLVALRMKVSRLRRAMRQGGPESEALAGDMMEMTEGAIRKIRHLVASMRPTTLDVGIVPALEWLADVFTRGTAIACRLQAPAEEPSLADAQATSIFRLVQEALTNVALHAEASRVDIELIREADNYLLSIVDDGKGITPEDLRKPALGLVGMREQTKMLGGRLDIDASIDKGTAVHIRFPVAANV